MQKKLRTLFITALVGTLLLFTACQSSVSLMQTRGEGYTAYYITLRLSNAEEQILNYTAANDPNAARRSPMFGQEVAGTPWTVVDYLTQLTSRAGMTLTANTEGNGFTHLTFRRVVETPTAPPSSGEANGQTTDPSAPVRINGFNPFIRRYRVTMAHPFNALHDDFTATTPRGFFNYFNNGFSTSTSVLLSTFEGGQIELDAWIATNHWQVNPSFGVNGIEPVALPDGTFTTRHHFVRHELPSFITAFPFADTPTFNPNNFRVSFVLSTNARYHVFGDDYMTREGRNRYYTFVARFDGSDYNQIVFEFTRPNPIGWYISAILAGGIAVGIIILALKLKAKKRFKNSPYSSELSVYGENGIEARYE